jgi:hypothetical protein
MEALSWLVGIYLVIGMFKALGHLGSGKVGLQGPLATFIAVTLLWPFI